MSARGYLRDLDEFVLQSVMRQLQQIGDVDPARRKQAKELGERIDAAAVELAGALLRAGVLLDRDGEGGPTT